MDKIISCEKNRVIYRALKVALIALKDAAEADDKTIRAHNVPVFVAAAFLIQNRIGYSVLYILNLTDWG